MLNFFQPTGFDGKYCGKENLYIMETVKEIFADIIKLLEQLFKLIKELVNTDTASEIEDVAAIAEEAGLLDAGKDLGGKVIDAAK